MQHNRVMEHAKVMLDKHSTLLMWFHDGVSV